MEKLVLTTWETKRKTMHLELLEILSFTNVRRETENSHAAHEYSEQHVQDSATRVSLVHDQL
jgi:hypothetical protein